MTKRLRQKLGSKSHLVAKGTDSDVQIHLLRPIWWIEQTGAVVGESIHLSIPEMGVNGKAKVLAIIPTKADSRKNTDPNYKAVTGKFIHDNAEVINLYFTHQETEPLGVTPNHLLWSVTHGGWMHAGDLNVGHVVKTKNGTETSLKKNPNPAVTRSITLKFISRIRIMCRTLACWRIMISLMSHLQNHLGLIPR